MKFFKGVTALDCIFCSRKFPLDKEDFRTINKHGWGCCSDCWEMNLPNANATNTTYIPPAVLRDIHAKREKKTA